MGAEQQEAKVGSVKDRLFGSFGRGPAAWIIWLAILSLGLGCMYEWFHVGGGFFLFGGALIAAWAIIGMAILLREKASGRPNRGDQKSFHAGAD